MPCAYAIRGALRHGLIVPPSSRMPLSLQRKVGLGFTLALLVLLAIGVAAYRGVRQMQTATAAERHSSAVLAAMAGVEEAVTHAETGQRGYLLLGNPRYLAPYHKAVRELPRDAALLRATALRDDSVRVTHLLGVLDRKQAELAETIVAWDAGEHARSLAIVRTARGKALMDSIRDDIGRREQRRHGLDLQYSLRLGGEAAGAPRTAVEVHPPCRGVHVRCRGAGAGSARSMTLSIGSRSLERTALESVR